MGICASCLGINRRDSHDSESSRLLDEDLYQASYGYGALNQANQSNHPDPEYLKREREALDAICQRTSDAVIDIWSLHPQPHLQPQATLQGSIATVESQVTTTTTGENIVTTSVPHSNEPGQNGTVPKHWGEVVINPRKKRSRPGLNTDETNGRDVFGVLKVT
ncbi:hypothetical protein ASPZODRAFT_805307 [Penicilliopsis zonata CBS 506.65]|uniref:Ragulator complex protein LAMTOR1 n=1 Tax=Penicilliopsis zonata CBS 506.65 TaxID=1073090 RepID=A0A1L9S9V4_9EURO|nr:hypothetical protein ASPZODRAFT_805307 [Penicilliopsis zonata CBS 506.65]OJJ43982.1 hypothetical protein ASPZODRAFT_805307 [Penicilliopsis zonata CBS 506.65]